MKKDTSHVIKRAERFQVILIGEGLLVGAIAGLIVLLYRILLGQAGIWLNQILNFAKGSTVKTAVWFAVLALLAWIVSRLVNWEPMISGSGIPQLEGEMTGKIKQVWWRVLPAKFVGGFLSLLGGLALGREGPSIQLGAMAGKGISRALDRGKTEEKFLLTCGASAGLSAAFHAPLAGVMFSLEEIHKNFSVSVLISVMTASLTADYISANFLGMESVFQFDIGNVLPQSYYWLILILGVVLGVMGAFYNWFTLFVQSLYKKIPKIGTFGKILIPFFMAGILGLLMPEVLGSGHNLVEALTSHEYLLGMVVLIFVIRFVFSAVSFGSGAPGGIFFPLLVLGAFIGGMFGMVGVQFFGMNLDYVNNFILLAMAGYFTAIVRAPLTGIILIFEMTGSVSQMLSLSVISIVAYIVATLLKSKPIYESLLERLLEKNGEPVHRERGEKILDQFSIMFGSPVANKAIQDIQWPENCLLVAIQRGGEEIIPKGKTILKASDIIVTMTDERDSSVVYDKMEKLCKENTSYIV
ncbi:MULTISPECIES: ClC family H(+)/Cl(-) exchange transporter [unclassified Clostridioides]|uniref:ClC family H(+)/Cl(-) exchange transporter n=1 Tax=unclassified Clostridioides TaxID=2635829 RepID=UPI001D11EF24|nr:chloride channel protein [Clostridioides sp. ES-S-0001-02]MCC0639675.1 chloride channel protein [Clostridioides sp. ES-S-0049-03]MCC0676398.1 chloride channel protein [Clostridioides sp. ES-W-0018-02]MCC0711401.1 chloride channel protein [Clostridioides sp. ES-W-0017-02]